MPAKAAKYGKVSLFFIVPIVVYLWTSSPVTAPFTLHLMLLGILAAVALGFVKKDSLQLIKTLLHITIILLLVGGTTWFTSPFFFLLYLVPMYLGFLYTPGVAFSFLAAVLVIFAINGGIGEVDISFDIMTLLSLLIAIPLVFFLRKKYLVIRQTTRDILILQNESGIADADTIGRLLSNRVTNLGVNVRQPLTFVKQAATMLLEDDLEPTEATKYLKRIKTTATETLAMIRQFEGETSANEVLSNKKVITKPTEAA